MSTPCSDAYLIANRLQCSQCSLFMVPPIYFCINGHNCCEDCKLKYSCRLCDEPMLFRNDALEEKAKNVHYSCKWELQCGSFISETIRDHEAACSHRIYACLSGCGFADRLRNLVDHINSNHSDVVLHEANVYSESVKRDNSWAMLSFSEFFTFKLEIESDIVRLTVNMCGPYSRAKNYHIQWLIGKNVNILKFFGYSGSSITYELPQNEVPGADNFIYTIVVAKNDN